MVETLADDLFRLFECATNPVIRDLVVGQMATVQTAAKTHGWNAAIRAAMEVVCPAHRTVTRWQLADRERLRTLLHEERTPHV